MRKFKKEMKKILHIKNKEYSNNWKYCSLFSLFNSLDKQVNRLKSLDFQKIEKNLSFLQHLNIQEFDTKNIIDIENIKRKLVHIANFSYFIFERLNKKV